MTLPYKFAWLEKVLLDLEEFCDMNGLQESSAYVCAARGAIEDDVERNGTASIPKQPFALSPIDRLFGPVEQNDQDVQSQSEPRQSDALQLGVESRI